ncbi:hypothetical protein [Pseudomonas protegens]
MLNHISASLPGTDHEFLINPYGLMFEKTTVPPLIR